MQWTSQNVLLVKRSTREVIEEKQLRSCMQYERSFLHFNYFKEKYCCSEDHFQARRIFRLVLNEEINL